jgi:hypothetical protein
LQAQELVNWVKKKSGTRPAIIAGDFHSSVAASAANGRLLVEDLNPDTTNLLRQSFVEATSPTWTPTCTYCPSTANPYNGAYKAGYAFAQIYVSNWADKATVDESILFKTAIVPTSSGTQMLSPSFGLNSVVLLPR